MTPVMVWQLLIFAAYAFGIRSPLWLAGWMAATIVVRIALMIWRAIQEVKAEEAKQAKRAKRE